MSGAPDTAAAARARAPSANALPVGSRVGDFEVASIIGEGGFGIVYEAFDHTLHRRVALKEYMPSALASRRGDFTVAVRSPQHEQTFRAGLRSFVNEARLLAQFDHPALVKVFRFWEANETAYMVMPLYEGRTLKDALKANPHPDENWLMGLLAPLLDALETLHNARCYHRDIAPDNILILTNGAPLLLDFGAARRIIGDLTQAVTVILKPGYAPIEQYADDASLKQGPWTDIYALSAVLCLAITGKAPSTSVTRMVSDPMGSLEQTVPGYSAGFLGALDRGLAVRPEQRPQSIAEFRSLLGLRTLAPVTSMPAPGTSTPPAAGAVGPDAAGEVDDDPAVMDEVARSMIAGQPQSWIRSESPEVPHTELAAAPVTVVNPQAYRPPAAPTGAPRPATGSPVTGGGPPPPWTGGPDVAPPGGVSAAGSTGLIRAANPTITRIPPTDGTRSRAAGVIPAQGGATGLSKARPGMAAVPSVTMGAVLVAVMVGGVWWFSRVSPAPPTPPTQTADSRQPPLPAPGGTVSPAVPPVVRPPAATPPPPPPGADALSPPRGNAPAEPAGARTSTTSGAAATPGAPTPPAGPVAAPSAPTGSSAPGASPGANGPVAGAPGAGGTTSVGTPGAAGAATVAAAAPVRPPRPLDCGFASPAAATPADGSPPVPAAAPVPPPPPSGRVPLSVQPWGQVYVDGRNCGLSPPKKDLLLPEGKYRLEVRNPTFETHVENIEVSARRPAAPVRHVFK